MEIETLIDRVIELQQIIEQAQLEMAVCLAELERLDLAQVQSENALQ